MAEHLSPKDLAHPALLPRRRGSISDPAVKYRMTYNSQALLQQSHVFLMWTKPNRGIIILLIIGSISLEKALTLSRGFGSRSPQEHQQPEERRRYWRSCL